MNLTIRMSPPAERCCNCGALMGETEGDLCARCDTREESPVARTVRELAEAQQRALMLEINDCCRRLGEPLRYPEAEPREVRP